MFRARDHFAVSLLDVFVTERKEADAKDSLRKEFYEYNHLYPSLQGTRNLTPAGEHRTHATQRIKN